MEKTTIFLKKLIFFLSVIWILLVLIDGYNQVTNSFFEHDEPYQGLQFLAGIRLYDGGPLYTDYRIGPSFYPYTPLIPMMFAGLMKIFGPSLLVIKSFAFLSGILSFIAIAFLSFRLIPSLWSSLLAVGLFAASYVFFDGWCFSLRPDNFGTMFTLWGFYFFDRYFRLGKKHWNSYLGIFLFTLAGLCKQSYFAYSVLFLILPFVIKKEHFKQIIFMALPSLIVGSTIWIYFNTGHEELSLVSGLMSKHPIFPLSTFPLIFTIIFTFLWPILATSLLAIAQLSKTTHAHWRVFYFLSLAIGVASHLKWGGSVNSLLPHVAFATTLLPYAFLSLYSHVEKFRPQFAHMMLLLPLPLLLIPLDTMTRKYVFAPPLVSESLKGPNIFIQNSVGKKIHFVRHDYVTYLASGQYYHTDFFNEVFYVIYYPVPEFFKNQIKEQYFDAIIGDFWNQDLIELRDHYYNLVSPPPFPDYPLYVKKLNQ